MITLFSLTGVIGYYAFLVVSIIFNVKISKIERILINLFFLIAVTILAYNFIPLPSLDLYRYYNYLNSIKSLEWNQIFSYGQYKSTAITQVFFYIIAISENYSLLSAIPTALLFIIIFNISYDFISKHKVPSQAYSFYVFSIISVSSISGILSGIRQNFSWVLLMAAVYYDFYGNKSNKITNSILYLVPILVHNSTIPFIIIRLMLPLINRFSKFKYFLFFWPVVLGSINLYIQYLPIVFIDSYAKLIEYIEIEPIISLKYIVSIIGYICILYFIYIIHNQNNQKINSKKFLNYYNSIVFFGLSSFFIPTLFTRSFEFVLYISLPLFTVVFDIKFPMKKTLITILLIIYILLFYSIDLSGGYPFLINV